ncbi:MAG: tRNA preQ1(34) S-adenosylmethionine ribosyltransferase-isomerase QueA [Patescibacteria group bacterium]
MDYKLSDFDYNLPTELIAQEQMSPRDHSRLLVLDKKTGDISHHHFFDIIDYLQAGDILVVNDSKVFPARLFGTKHKTGGVVEVFLHKNITENTWECLLGGRVAEGLVIELAKNFHATVEKNNNDGTWLVSFNKSGQDFFKIINKIGHLPLPPYIKRSEDRAQDKKNYQTAYANSEKIGSVAAPTAGLHFTPRLLQKIKDKGIAVEMVTLHVGMGTFSAIKTDNILEHKMHSEYAEISSKTIQVLKRAKQDKKRIIAVGTTSCRTLESWAKAGFPDNFGAWTDIFIYPGYKFKVVSALITNFHLPKSSLLLLVSALAGKNNIDFAYSEAILQKYRFFSYGDAMFIV